MNRAQSQATGSLLRILGMITYPAALGSPQPIDLEPGTILSIPNSRGQIQTLQILSSEPASDHPGISLYAIVRQDLDTQEWDDICVPDTQGNRQAIILSGYWNQTGSYRDSKDPDV